MNWSRYRSGFQAIAAPCALVLLVAAVFLPGFGAYWGRDDFAQLAYMRMIGSPWPLFTTDHFFAAGSVFRPLGFASLWLGQALFGTDYPRHAAFDLLLHAAVALALYGLIRMSALPRWAALLCTALFALHPVAIGTALWWSARFDVLATLFALLALRAAFAYRDRQKTLALVVCVSASLAAALSKEVGLAVLVPIGLIALGWAWANRTQRAHAFRLALSCLAVGVGYFAWRWLVLGTPTSQLTDTQLPLVQAAAKGFGDWAGYLAGYLGFWPRLGPLERLLLGISLPVLALAVLLSWPLGRSAQPRRDWTLVVSGLALVLVPALLQAPVVALNGAALSPDASELEVAMQSRLYYLGLAGAVLALSVPFARMLASRLRLGVGLGMLLAVAGWAWCSYWDADAYARRSRAIAAAAPAAIEAVSKLDNLPARNCHVFLLGLQPAPEWGVFVSMDSVVKALAPDPARLGHCFIHTNYKTIFYLMARDTDPGDAAPFLPRESRTGRIPWPGIGDVTIAYLLYQPERELPDPRDMIFLRYENGAFRDVGEEVRAGRIVVRMP